MKEICNLSYDKFVTNGEVKAGLPLYENNLIAYYPLEEDTLNIVPEVKIYVENNQLIKKGIKAANAININGATYENNMIKLNGTKDSYISINSNIFNSHKNYKIEIEFIPTKSNKNECLLFIGDKYSINEYYNIWNDCSTQTLSIKRMNGDQKFSTDISYPCSSLPGQINKLTLYSNKNSFFISYINDNYNKIYYNSKERNPTTIYPITDDNYFNGYIKSITINTYDDLNQGQNDVKVFDFGFMGYEAGENIVTTDNKYYGVNWTIGKNLFFEKTKDTIYDMPIYRIRIKPDTQELLNQIKEQWSVGIRTDVISLNPNQDACSYILYRPLTFKDSTKITGAPSNVLNSWETQDPIDLKNGWNLAYKYRINKSEQFADNIFWTFYSNDLEINDELVIECSPIMFVKDSQIPIGLSFDKTNSNKNNDISADISIINNNINEFSLSYEWIFSSHTNNYDYPNHLWLGGYPGDTPKSDWIALYYNGKGWSNCDTCFTEYSSKESNIRGSNQKIYGFKKYLGHNFKVMLSYNKKEKILRGMLYDKTLNKILNSFEKDNLIFNNFSKLYFNYRTYDIIKNFAIYNRSFNLDEMQSLAKKDFKIIEDGSIYIDYLKEADYFSYRNSYYLPLDDSTKSLDYRLDCVENSPNLFNKDTIVDGYIFNDGLIKPSINNDFTSDFIPIKERTIYTFNVFNCTKENTPAVAWFDINKKIISRDIQNFNGNCAANFTSPERAMFARLTSRWKDEVKITFKEYNANNIEYIYDDGGINAGRIKCKSIINLTPNYKAPLNKDKNVGWDNNLHKDALAYPDWSIGCNTGVEHPEIGYHAKWVNEGPEGNSCIKIINYNSIYGYKNRWIGMNRYISNLLNNVKIGDTIQICFKAKSLNSTWLRAGIHRTAISTNSQGFYQLKEQKLNTSWNSYSIEIPVDNDWKLDGIHTLYFYGYNTNQPEDIIWISDIYLVINGPKITNVDILKTNQELDLTYNLTDDIDMDWRKPWHISFWRKPISNDMLKDYNLFSIGTMDNKDVGRGYICAGFAVKGYVYIGYKDFFFDLKAEDFYNQWGYVTIDYNGSNIILRYRGEKFYFEKQLNITIDKKDYFKNPNRKSDLFLGSYRGVLNNTTTKDLLIIKNRCLTEEENKIFQTLMKYDYTLKNRINLIEEDIVQNDLFLSNENNQNITTNSGEDILI